MSFNLTQQDQWLIKNCPALDEVTAIVYYGRSGSVFLQSLLDNHPQILMVPGTTLLYYSDFWNRYSTLAKSDLIDKFCEYFAPFFDVNADAQLGLWKHPAKTLGLDKMGKERNEIVHINKNDFAKVINLIFNETEVNSKSLFQAIHAAYTIALGRTQSIDTSRLPIIVYQLHCPGHRGTALLSKDFPKLKVIQMVREPLQTLGSHFKHHMEDFVLKSSYYSAFLHCPNEAVTVRLEDLHTDPKNTLIKVAEWLEIDWSESLLNSTFDGKKWWNIKGTDKVSGFNKTIISKNHQDIYYKIDIYRLKILYAKRYSLWKYGNSQPTIWQKLSLLFLLPIPFKIEVLHFKHLYGDKKQEAIQYALFGWWKKRNFLFRAWLYTFTSQIKELKCL